MRWQILYFNDQSLVAFELKKQALISQKTFAIDRQGLLDWVTYCSYLQLPLLVLVDSVAEEYLLKKLPNLAWGKNKTLQQRKLNSIFADTDYKFAKVQFTAPAVGRKKSLQENQVLFGALRDFDFIQQLFTIILKQQLPLAGILSAALLCEQLATLKAQNLFSASAKSNANLYPAANSGLSENASCLIVYWQNQHKMRHVFLQRGKLAASRICQADNALDITQFLEQEVQKTLLYLQTHLKLSANAIQNVYYINFKPQQIQLPSATANFSYTELRADANANADLAPSGIRALFFSQLAQQKKQYNFFASAKQIAVYKRSLYSRYTFYSSGAIFLMSIICVLWLFWQGHSYTARIAQLKNSEQFFAQQYQAELASAGKLNASAAQMQSAVLSVAKLEQKFKLLPQQFMLQLSQILNDFSAHVTVAEIMWQQRTKNFENAKILTQPATAHAHSYEATVRCILHDFEHSPRRALEIANQVLSRLQQSGKFKTVIASELPFDLSSKSAFSMGSEHNLANEQIGFSFKVVGSGDL